MRNIFPMLRGFSCLMSFCLILAGCAERPVPTAPKTKTAEAKPVTAAPAPAVTTPAPSSVQTAQPFRVKAGSTSAFTDASGNVWLADQGFDDGDMIDRDPSLAIAGTKDPGLFLSEHYGMSGFSCKLPNGKYTAKLYFAETFDGINGPGERVFSFNVQGHEFKDFDVWAKAGGPNHAYIESVAVEVTNGVFHISFTSNIENPEINAIEIIPAS